MVTINTILERAKKYLPGVNESRLLRAFDFAETAHGEQKRFSGEAYISHPLEVTNILLDFQPDEDTIISALLHDVAEDTTYTLEDIEKVFGSQVKNLCWGMVKLSKVKSKLNDPQVENLRKLFLAMAKDFRVVLIKLCDRLHNMRTLQYVRPEKQMRIAQETLNVYAPIAARLGIYRLKSQLEDLCFEILNPEQYGILKEQLLETGKEREKFIELAKKVLMDELAKEGIQAHVDGRVKSIYSIYRKLQRKNKNAINEIFDVFAMRVVLPDIYKYGKEYSGHLYTALGIIHNKFTPLANRFKDYVAVPKVNGYRSLHTTVVGIGPKEYTQPTEIQLRTQSMHQGAELGIAAHWIYEEGSVAGSGKIEDAVANTAAPMMQRHHEWISGLEKIQREIKNNSEFWENLRVDIFQDRIFVLTPRGDVKDLPVSATPIDFAYSVHTDVGNHCVGAKVNGKIVPLDYELKSGEVVDVITKKIAQPNAHWLTFVKTNHAKNRIRSWFRNLDDDKYLRSGREILNTKLLQLGKPTLDDGLSVLKHYDGKSLSMVDRVALLTEVGKGAVFASTVIKKIFSIEDIMNSSKREAAVSTKTQKKRASSLSKAKTDGTPKLIIGDALNVPYHFVKCCNATYVDELIGYTTRGGGISVHRKDCAVVFHSEPKRLVSVKLSSRPSTLTRYPVHVRLLADDRIGLMRDVSHLIAESGVNIIDIMRLVTKENSVQLDVVMEIVNFDQLDRMLSKLENIPNVRRAFKVS